MTHTFLPLLLLLLNLLLLLPDTFAICWTDVPGSYGDSREIQADQFASLVGIACSGTCYKKASRWSLMAIAHGNKPVQDITACRNLCAGMTDCEVFTYNQDSLTCRAMRSLETSPTLASVPNTTTGKPFCNDNTSHVLPFPGLTTTLSFR